MIRPCTSQIKQLVPVRYPLSNLCSLHVNIFWDPGRWTDLNLLCGAETIYRRQRSTCIQSCGPVIKPFAPLLHFFSRRQRDKTKKGGFVHSNTHSSSILNIRIFQERILMEAESEYQSWDDEQIRQALGLILSRLSLQDGVSEPHFCHEIDLTKWSNCPQQPDQLDRIVQVLITRTSGSMGTLCVSGLQSDSIFTFIAHNAGCLQTLRIPNSSLSDLLVEQLAGRLSMISSLDVSYCMNMSARGLEVIGKNCILLEGLCRNMHPWHTGDHDEPSRDDEAMAISSTMPKLKHLEIACHWMTSEGVHKILCACSDLEYFDMWGCENVKAGNLDLHKFPKLTVWGPRSSDCFGGDHPSEAMEIE